MENEEIVGTLDDTYDIHADKDPGRNKLYTEMRATNKTNGEEVTLHVLNVYVDEKEKQTYYNNMLLVKKHQETMKTNIIKIIEVVNTGRYNPNKALYKTKDKDNYLSSLYYIVLKPACCKADSLYSSMGNKSIHHSDYVRQQKELLKILKEMEMHNIYHCDIRPSTISILEKKNIYLGGWDFATTDENSNDIIQLRRLYDDEAGITSKFMPPEFFSPEYKIVPCYVDPFSFGVVLYYLQRDSIPFNNSNDATYNKYLNQFTGDQNIKQTMDVLMKKDPYTRMKFSEIEEKFLE